MLGECESVAPHAVDRFPGSECAGGMQLLTGAEQDGNVNSRVMSTLSLQRSTELGRF